MAKTKKVATKPKATGSEDALQRVISQIEKQYGQGAITVRPRCHHADG